MIGRNQGDIAGRDMLPELFDFGTRADRRIDLGLAAEPGDIVFLVQRQIVNAALDGGGIALVAIGARDLVAAGERAVDDVGGAIGLRAGFVDLPARPEARSMAGG